MPRLLSAIAVTATALWLVGCHTVSDWGRSSRTALLPGDVVVIGRLENLKSEPAVYAPGDLLGHGWFSGILHVSRVESGELSSEVVPVRYFGHTQLREDVSFRFRLRPDESGYLICKRPGAGSGLNCDRRGDPKQNGPG